MMPNRLSICIPTLNRSVYIGETLNSIATQLQDGVEIVIVDGGSTDGTEQIVNSYQRSFPSIRYFRKDASEKKSSNEGFDRDCNYAVELASGEYCWLMTDDDLLKPGAIGRVLSELGKNYFLIVAGAEVRSSNFAELLVPNRPNFLSDRIYKPSEWDEFAVALIGHLTFVGAVIVKRELWLSRRKEKYFGSGFVHVGVLFDEKISGDIYIASAPLVTIRFGNAQWVNRAFQIWMVNWPNLVWSFSSISDSAKVKICPREPWASLKTLLFNRALGVYSMREYELFISDKPSSSGRKKLSKLIAGLPRWLLYIPAWLYVRLLLPNSKYVLFNLNESWRGRL